MGFLNSTPEEKQARAEAKAAESKRREIEEWRASPTGQARTAFERGDEIFQVAMPLRQQNAAVVAMVGAYSSPGREKDWSAELTGVVREGWDVVTASMVFIETGSESRDKFLASGQQIAVKGEVVGYYVFRRAEENRVPSKP